MSDPSIELFCEQKDLKIMSSRIGLFLVAVPDPTVRLDLFMKKRDILYKALELKVNDLATVLVNYDNRTTATTAKAMIKYMGPLPGEIGCYFGIELLVCTLCKFE